jgi:hypothetical protein
MDDFHVENHISIILLQPLTPAAWAFVDEHLPEDAMRYAGAIVVEPRYIDDIVEGARAEGLTVN